MFVILLRCTLASTYAQRKNIWKITSGSQIQVQLVVPNHARPPLNTITDYAYSYPVNFRLKVRVQFQRTFHSVNRIYPYIGPCIILIVEE